MINTYDNNMNVDIKYKMSDNNFFYIFIVHVLL